MLSQVSYTFQAVSRWRRWGGPHDLKVPTSGPLRPTEWCRMWTTLRRLHCLPTWGHPETHQLPNTLDSPTYLDKSPPTSTTASMTAHAIHSSNPNVALIPATIWRTDGYETNCTTRDSTEIVILTSTYSISEGKDTIKVQPLSVAYYSCTVNFTDRLSIRTAVGNQRTTLYCILIS